MNIPKINAQETMPQKGRKIGATTGALVSGAYLLKNRQDIFVNTIKRSVEMFGTKGKGILASGISAGITTVALTTLGALVGSLTGKIIQNVQMKKAKAVLGDVLTKMTKDKDVKHINVEDLGKFFAEQNTAKTEDINPELMQKMAELEHRA